MSNAISVIDSDAIVEARVRGESIRSIAKRLKVSITDIHDTLDRFAKVTISQNLRTHTLALELERLDNLQQAYEQQARAGDIQAAMLVAKLIERRCIMLGLSAPPRVGARFPPTGRPSRRRTRADTACGWTLSSRPPGWRRSSKSPAGAERRYSPARS